jgi:hypothetical protein
LTGVNRCFVGGVVGVADLGVVEVGVVEVVVVEVIVEVGVYVVVGGVTLVGEGVSVGVGIVVAVVGAVETLVGEGGVVVFIVSIARAGVSGEVVEVGVFLLVFVEGVIDCMSIGGKPGGAFNFCLVFVGGEFFIGLSTVGGDLPVNTACFVGISCGFDFPCVCLSESITVLPSSLLVWLLPLVFLCFLFFAVFFLFGSTWSFVRSSMFFCDSSSNSLHLAVKVAIQIETFFIISSMIK